jgi:streptomycin 6-kinase
VREVGVEAVDVSVASGTAVDGPARAKLVERFGPGVAAWCDDVPRLVGSVAARWQLRVRRALPAGGTSVLFDCRVRDGVPVVLKLTPDHAIAAGEAAALEAWADSAHVVRLRDADLDRGALLLEFIEPGVPLSEDPAGWDLTELTPLLTDLWSPRPWTAVDAVPQLRDRVEFLFDLTRHRLAGRPDLGRILPPELLESSRGRALVLAGGGSAGLVHGDLHPGNVLRAERGLVAIDPRPCVGDRAFDAIDWVLGPAVSRHDVDRRIDRLAEDIPTVDPDRVLAWCHATAVLLAAGVLRRDAEDPRGRFLAHVAATPPE